MKTCNRTVLLSLILFGWTVSTALAPPERYRLYTKSDPSSKGGIKGYITSPKLPLVQILAMPPDEPRFVYEGKIMGPNRREFLFEGLPMRKYNLFAIFENKFYEGLELHRDENTLTREDLKKIDYIVQASEPFFTKKVIHRLEGTTGRGNFARCVCTFLRDRLARGNSGHRRTFKLIVLKDVGPGWQFVRSRDLYPLFVKPAFGLPQHNYSKTLSKIRVTDHIKDLGKISLTEK